MSDKKRMGTTESGDTIFTIVKLKNSVELTDVKVSLLHVVGQYDGRSKPLPEYHAKITGFDERVCFYC